MKNAMTLLIPLIIYLLGFIGYAAYNLSIRETITLISRMLLIYLGLGTLAWLLLKVVD